MQMGVSRCTHFHGFPLVTLLAGDWPAADDVKRFELAGLIRMKAIEAILNRQPSTLLGLRPALFSPV